MTDTTYKVGDIVTRTTDHFKPYNAYNKNVPSDKGKVGIVVNVTDNLQDDVEHYYELSDGYLYDGTEIRFATKYEIRAAFRNVMENYGRLAETY